MSKENDDNGSQGGGVDEETLEKNCNEIDVVVENGSNEDYIFRPDDDTELKLDTRKYKDRHSKRDHTRKFAALILLIVGFFLAVSLDLYLAPKDHWVSDLFTKTIIPVLAFVLGTTIERK